MATLVASTTSKGAGNYVGETKKQLRDGECNSVSFSGAHSPGIFAEFLINLECPSGLASPVLDWPPTPRDFTLQASSNLRCTSYLLLYFQVLEFTTIPTNSSGMKENGVKARNTVIIRSSG